VPHNCTEKVKGLCQVKSVPSGARRTSRFDDLNNPRPGGRVSPPRNLIVIDPSPATFILLEFL
jgi:hypothetical protein